MPALDDAARLAGARAFFDAIPHNRALGIEVVAMGDGAVQLRLPYHEQLVGNPDTGVLHGGAITALLDAACGAAVFAAMPRMQPIATLDLRIDYASSAFAGVWTAVECDLTQ